MERPHFSYLTTRWQGLRLLIAQVHLTQSWHYSLAVIFAFAVALSQQALEQAFSESEERLRQEIKIKESGKLSWKKHATRTCFFAPRIVMTYLTTLLAITLDVGILIALIIGMITGFLLFRRRLALGSDSSLRHKIP